MTKTTATFFSDAGHGWLGVKRTLLKELNILQKISGFSYQKGGTVYLEEDSDVSTLFNALKDKHGINNLDEVFTIKTSYKERSPVRSYARFMPNKVEKFYNGQKLKLYGQNFEVVEIKNNKIYILSENGMKYRLSSRQKDEVVEIKGLPDSETVKDNTIIDF